MPQLPNAELAEIPEEKIRDYLLATSHPVGRFKAAFFFRLGYTLDEYEQLIEAVRALVLSQDAIRVEQTEYGQKYIVRGLVAGPNGRSAMLETVWIVLNSTSHPRFVTAYPGD